MMLRNVILAICGLLVAAAIVEYALGRATWLVIGLQAIVVIALLAFERSRYRPRIKSGSGEWVPTGEKFEDPTSGKTVEVYQNPQSGEREYRGSA
jgi:hypothetical protein